MLIPVIPEVTNKLRPTGGVIMPISILTTIINADVLLRYLLDDDIEQSPKAKKIITGTDKILVTDIVIIETVWTLKGKNTS